ncbi:response regulator [bacterium]|nr:response regulator [bacterium]
MTIEAVQEIAENVDLSFEQELRLVQEKPSKAIRKRVLVVDDDPLVVKVLRTPLERAGFAVNTACHGLEALQKVKQAPPDLIILDILMPLLDGFKVARFLKFDKRFKDIPIVVLTSRATEGEREMGKQVGANEFLFKPFRLPQVMAMVQKYLNN